MDIIGRRVKIKEFKLEDAYLMRKWGKHENLLLEDYNFPDMTDKQLEDWYHMKTRHMFDKYYSIYDIEEKDLIGYMGTKNINLIRKSSTLGIVLDPKRVSLGYGSDILESFLEYYFSSLKMKRMYLEVAEFNTRAYRLYEKMGFKNIGYYMDEISFPKEHINNDNKYYMESKSFFVIDGGKVYNYIYRMELIKDDFIKKRKHGVV